MPWGFNFLGSIREIEGLFWISRYAIAPVLYSVIGQ
jgi:hypothetical protein